MVRKVQPLWFKSVIREKKSGIFDAAIRLVVSTNKKESLRLEVKPVEDVIDVIFCESFGCLSCQLFDFFGVEFSCFGVFGEFDVDNFLFGHSGFSLH